MPQSPNNISHVRVRFPGGQESEVGLQQFIEMLRTQNVLGNMVNIYSQYFRPRYPFSLSDSHIHFSQNSALTGHDVYITGGHYNANVGGDLRIYAPTNDVGGGIKMVGGGCSTYWGVAGTIALYGGAALTANAYAGNVVLEGGGGHYPGNVFIRGGSSATGMLGGDVQISGGTSYSSTGAVRVANQANGTLSFFGVTPVLRQTIAASPTTAEIVTLLSNYGLASVL